MSGERPVPDSPDWIRGGRGIGPDLKWTFTAEGPLTSLKLIPETGEVVGADEGGMLFRLDRRGGIAAITRVRHPVRVLDWSADGRWGVAVVGEATLHRFDRDFQSVWKIDLPEVCIAVTIAPYGTHLVACMADARNFIISEHRRREAEFETMRPLSFARLCTTEPILVAAAEHGLLGCYSLKGEEIWHEKLWTNVGGVEITGDASLIYLAAYHHGIQTFDGDGGSVGSYIVEGTVSRVAVSYEPNRLLASTLERHLYWLDAEGEMLWATTAPDDVALLQCDPLGEWCVCGFEQGRVMRLDWGGGGTGQS
jgi:hypothetical protein